MTFLYVFLGQDISENSLTDVDITPINYLENELPPSQNIEGISALELTILSDIFGKLEKVPVHSNGLVHYRYQYGVTLIIPEGAVKQSATVWIGACLYSDKFEFEDDYVPVTPIVWVYIDCELYLPVELHFPHYIDVEKMSNSDGFFLLKADDNNSFKFSIYRPADITVESKFFKATIPSFCSECIAIKKMNYQSIPKRYQIARVDKEIDDQTLEVDFCFLFERLDCRKVGPPQLINTVICVLYRN